MSKYYLSKDVSKPVNVGGKLFTFTACDYFEPSHSWWGTFAAETAEDIAALDEAVTLRAITEITEEEYLSFEQKKNTAKRSKNFIDFASKHPPQTSAPSGQGVRVVEEPAPVKPEPQLAMESFEDAITAKPTITKGRK